MMDDDGWWMGNISGKMLKDGDTWILFNAYSKYRCAAVVPFVAAAAVFSPFSGGSLQVVKVIEELFNIFDDLTDKYGVYKATCLS